MKKKRHVCGEIVILGDDGKYYHRRDPGCAGQPLDACPSCHYPLEDGWFRSLYRVEPMTRGMMERTITFGRYACSNCWGYGLVVQNVLPDEGAENQEMLYRVLCAECMEETLGYVSSGYIGRAREQDYLNYLDVRNTLGKELGFEVPERMSIEHCLHDLGFGL